MVAGRVEQLGGSKQLRGELLLVALSAGDVSARLADCALPGAALPAEGRSLGDPEVAVGFIEVTEIGASDGGGDGEHDRAESTPVRLPQGGLGAVNFRPSRGRIRRRDDHRAVNTLQKVRRDDRPAREGQGPQQELLSLLPVSLGEPNFGQPLHRMRFARRGADIAVQVNRLDQFPFGPSQVAHEQRGFPDECCCEGHAAQRTGLRCAAAEVLSILDDLAIGDRPVEQILSDT